MNTRSITLALLLTLSTLILGGACGAPDSESSPSPEAVDESEQEVGQGASCHNVYGPFCDAGLTCCGSTIFPVYHAGSCRDLQTDIHFCGSCTTDCASQGYKSCAAGACVPRCTYHDECPSDQICLPYNGITPYSGDAVSLGHCASVNCTADSQCTPHDGTGGMNQKLKCCSNHCVAMSSDPLHCNLCTNSECNFPTDVCYTDAGGTKSCGSAALPCPANVPGSPWNGPPPNGDHYSRGETAIPGGCP